MGSSLLSPSRLSRLKQPCARFVIGETPGAAGAEGTYVHGDVNYPLRHRLVEEHGLRLPSGIPAEQPKHSHQLVSGTTARGRTPLSTPGRGADRTEFPRDKPTELRGGAAGGMAQPEREQTQPSPQGLPEGWRELPSAFRRVTSKKRACLAPGAQNSLPFWWVLSVLPKHIPCPAPGRPGRWAAAQQSPGAAQCSGRQTP